MESKGVMVSCARLILDRQTDDGQMTDRIQTEYRQTEEKDMVLWSCIGVHTHMEEEGVVHA